MPYPPLRPSSFPTFLDLSKLFLLLWVNLTIEDPHRKIRLSHFFGIGGFFY